MNERLTNSDRLSLLSEAVEINELTNQERVSLLGALGLYTCEFDDYDNPPEPLNIFKSIN